MDHLHQTRCMNHAAREAVARCPACKNFFCRECVTEHGGRVMCAACIQKTGAPEVGRKSGAFKAGLERCTYAAKMFFGLFLLWIFFYGIGQLLLLIPDSFHTGDLWRGV